MAHRAGRTVGTPSVEEVAGMICRIEIIRN